MTDKYIGARDATAPPETGLDRRQLLKHAGAAGAAMAAVAGPLAPEAYGSGRDGQHGHDSRHRHGKYLVPRDRIGCGLATYRFSQTPPADIYSVLGEIRDIGYRATELLEFTGFPGGIPRALEVRGLLREADLHGVGNFHYLGFGGPDLSNSLDRFIAEDAAAGMRDLGFVAHRQTPATQTEAYYRQLAQTFNEWGRVTKKAGMKFYVHNESWVFDRDPTTGKVLYDVWIEETDPELVFFNLDTAWMASRGLDLVQYVRKLERHDRITHFHIKDWNGTSQVTPTPDVGKGVIDWRRFFRAIKKPEKYWYIVESEGRNATETAAASYDFLATLKDNRKRPH